MYQFSLNTSKWSKKAAVFQNFTPLKQLCIPFYILLIITWLSVETLVSWQLVNKLHDSSLQILYFFMTNDQIKWGLRPKLYKNKRMVKNV